jgi:hypothetical protein
MLELLSESLEVTWASSVTLGSCDMSWAAALLEDEEFCNELEARLASGSSDTLNWH